MKLRVLALLALTASVFGDTPQEKYSAVTATTTSAQVQFGFPARRVTVVNDGAVTVYVDGRCATATSADPAVLAGETYEPPEPGRGHDGRVCISVLAASSTAALRIYAYE